MSFICDNAKLWPPIAFGEPWLPGALLPHLVPRICAQTKLAPRECGRLQASQEVWLLSRCLLLLSLENFTPVSTTPAAPRGLWGMALAHGLLPHAWAWMCSFHLGFARRVQSQRLAEGWQRVPEVTLVASRWLGALGWRRREAVPNCVLAMTADGQSPRWPGTASGQLFLTGALQRPRWGTPSHPKSGGCARPGQCGCHCHQELCSSLYLYTAASAHQ